MSDNDNAKDPLIVQIAVIGFGAVLFTPLFFVALLFFKLVFTVQRDLERLTWEDVSRWMSAPLWGVTLLLLAGCTSAVTLRHEDGRMVKCGPYNAYGVRAFMAAQQESQCISDFQRQGFERAPD